MELFPNVTKKTKIIIKWRKNSNSIDNKHLDSDFY